MDTHTHPDFIHFSSGIPVNLEMPMPEDKQSCPRFSGIAYSGGQINLWDGPGVIDVASTKFAEGDIPLLLQHRADCRLGVCKQKNADGMAMTVSGNFLANSPMAAQVVSDAKDGFPFQMSVGLYDITWEEVPPGKQINCNGQMLTGPLTIMRNGTVREVSIVSLGADANTTVAAFARNNITQLKSSEKTDMDLTQALARVAELEATLRQRDAELAASRTELEGRAAELAAARTQLETQAKTARLSEIKRDFESLGWEFSEEKAQPYIGLSVDQYAAVFGAMRDMRAKIPAEFTREQASAGAQNPAAPNTVEAEVAAVLALLPASRKYAA